LHNSLSLFSFSDPLLNTFFSKFSLCHHRETKTSLFSFSTILLSRHNTGQQHKQLLSSSNSPHHITSQANKKKFSPLLYQAINPEQNHLQLHNAPSPSQRPPRPQNHLTTPITSPPTSFPVTHATRQLPLYRSNAARPKPGPPRAGIHTLNVNLPLRATLDSAQEQAEHALER
jgi:hypothetical protein